MPVRGTPHKPLRPGPSAPDGCHLGLRSRPGSSAGHGLGLFCGNVLVEQSLGRCDFRRIGYFFSGNPALCFSGELARGFFGGLARLGLGHQFLSGLVSRHLVAPAPVATSAQQRKNFLQIGQPDRRHVPGRATAGTACNHLHFRSSAVAGWRFREPDQVARVQEAFSPGRPVAHIERLCGLEQVYFCLPGGKHVRQHQWLAVLQHGDAQTHLTAHLLADLLGNLHRHRTAYRLLNLRGGSLNIDTAQSLFKCRVAFDTDANLLLHGVGRAERHPDRAGRCCQRHRHRETGVVAAEMPRFTALGPVIGCRRTVDGTHVVTPHHWPGFVNRTSAGPTRTARALDHLTLTAGGIPIGREAILIGRLAVGSGFLRRMSNVLRSPRGTTLVAVSTATGCCGALRWGSDGARLSLGRVAWATTGGWAGWLGARGRLASAGTRTSAGHVACAATTRGGACWTFCCWARCWSCCTFCGRARVGQFGSVLPSGQFSATTTSSGSATAPKPTRASAEPKSSNSSLKTLIPAILHPDKTLANKPAATGRAWPQSRPADHDCRYRVWSPRSRSGRGEPCGLTTASERWTRSGLTACEGRWT